MGLFDGADVYCTHLYVRGQFLCSTHSKRADECGVFFKSHILIVVKVITRARERVSANYPVSVHLSDKRYYMWNNSNFS